MKLWKLEKVHLREVWKHEALDFTNWVAKEENLSLLSDEISIEIKLIETEASVWGFNVDILAEEENTWKKIIIENQLEQTDHKHLWQVLTYASWIDAEFIIWIVEDVREEHKQAIDWLNEHTDEKINFFIIKMELWKIWDSNIAPKFNIISKPNDWSKLIKTLSTENKELSETKLNQLDFWNNLKNYFNEKWTKLSLRKAWPQHWYDLSLWNSLSHISLTVNSQNNLLWAEIYIDSSKDLFDYLYEKKDLIEKDLGFEMEWDRLDLKKGCRIKLIKENCIFKNKDEWDKFFEWFYIVTPKLYSTFKKYIKNFN